MKRSRGCPRALLVAAALLAALAAGARARAGESEPALRAHDRVVLCGDSITEQRLYSRFVRQYVAARHPDLDVRFWNAGWGGDTAAGARARLERDVLPLKPTLVTLFFGMNDGGYRPPDPAVRAAYKDNLTALVEAIQKAGARVVVFTPGCIDPDGAKGMEAYNDTLESLAETALDVAKAHGCASADVFHPMLKAQRAMKARNPSFTMIPDHVHPDGPGHLVVAAAMLRALGVDPMPALGAIDLAGSGGDGLRVEKREAREVALAATRPWPTPFWFEAGGAPLMEVSGFLRDLAGQRLEVKGLPAGAWALEIDGRHAGVFPAADLAHGVYVAGTWSSRGKALHDLVAQQENGYFRAWREVRLPFQGVEGLDALLAALAKEDDAWHEAVLAQGRPRPGPAIVLQKEPSGPNLALHRPFEASDPNRYAWGKDGLTDGSWEASSAHCFATGDAPAFPKAVTIDLGKALRVGVVRFGVPEFGSTKTVVVSVSGDGKGFTEVGRHVFEQRLAARATVAFPTRSARWVRLTYLDRHEAMVNFPVAFCFTTEVEAFESR